MGLNVSDLKGWKDPMPSKGHVVLRILEAREITGKKPDANGEVSTGMGFKLEIAGPASATMNDGSPALAFSFDHALFLPRASLVESNPRVATRMRGDFARFLEAAFGNDIPDEVSEDDWTGKLIAADIYVAFDAYRSTDVVKLGSVRALTEAEIEEIAIGF